MINFDNLWPFGIIIGCFSSNGRLELANLPPTRSRSFPSINGFNVRIELPFGKPWWVCNFLISISKASFCASLIVALSAVLSSSEVSWDVFLVLAFVFAIKRKQYATLRMSRCNDENRLNSIAGFSTVVINVFIDLRSVLLASSSSLGSMFVFG